MHNFFLRYRLPVLLWVGVLLFLSSRAQHEFPKFDIPHLDKAVHFVLYFIFSFLIARLLYHRYFSTKPLVAIAIAVGFASVYGVCDEYFQTFAPGRAVEFFDIVADILGASCGGLFLFQYLKIRQRYLLSKNLVD